MRSTNFLNSALLIYYLFYAKTTYLLCNNCIFCLDTEKSLLLLLNIKQSLFQLFLIEHRFKLQMQQIFITLNYKKFE